MVHSTSDSSEKQTKEHVQQLFMKLQQKKTRDDAGYQYSGWYQAFHLSSFDRVSGWKVKLNVSEEQENYTGITDTEWLLSFAIFKKACNEFSI